MIAAGLLLVAIGLADVARQFFGGRRRGGRFAAGMVVAVLVALAALGLGQITAAVIVLFGVACWALLMPSVPVRAVAGFWPAIALAVVAVVLVVTPSPEASGWLADAWQRNAVLATVPLAPMLLLVGVLAFLLESGNIVVRTALQSERRDADTESAPAPPRRGSGILGRIFGAPEPVPDDPGKTLRGGRLIGPLERLFVVGLIFANALPLLVALIAAKGIVRFPEIQRDRGQGTQAEYFLVGSMTSWGIALAGAALLWAVGASPATLVVG